MDEETKARAKEKAEAVIEKIGYPDMLDNTGELDEYYISVRYAQLRTLKDLFICSIAVPIMKRDK